ncbi:MAG TPA: hypothetical protein VE964_11240 [Myxococcales bacterium]|nr:hypothetical protein [Myxococcales bacterium]
MAGGGKEQRRMVFDIRGRRRNVVKVVYAALAILMGASLILVAGPGINLGSLFGGGETGAAAKAAEEQAERYERKLAKSPEDPDLLLGLTRARISVAQASVSGNPETGEVEPTLETRQQYEKASEAWSKYLKTTKEPNVGAAQQVATALFTLAQISRTPAEITANMQAAADTQKIVVDARSNLGTLSNFALYSTYAFDYDAAEKAAEKVKKLATTKFERENFENSFEETTKSAKEFQKQLVRQAKQNQGAGKQAIENPLSGVGGTSGLGE